MGSASLRTSIFIGVGVGLAVFCFLLVFALWEGSPVSAKLITAHAHYMQEKPNGSMMLACQDKAVDAAISRDDLLATTMSFYEAVIQILIAVLGIIGFVAFMYIRSASMDHAEQVVEAKVTEKLNKNDFHELLKKYLSEGSVGQSLRNEIADARKGLDSFFEEFDAKYIGERLGGLEESSQEFSERMAAVEKALSQLDTSEAQGEGLTLKSPRGDDNGHS